MTYTTNSVEHEQLELLSKADIESVQIESMDLEGIESLLEENLESIPLESVAEDVEEYMEEDIESRGSSRDVYRRLTKVFIILTKKAVKKITMNPRTRSKLLIACRQGPYSVTHLITPIVAKPLPSYFRFLAFTFCPPIVTRLFRSICKEAGLKPEEIEAAPELWGFVARWVAKKVARTAAGALASKYRRKYSHR